MMRTRLDSRDKMPSGMEEYLAFYGWHFNKKLCDWAISNMWKTNSKGEKEKIQKTTKEQLTQLLKVNNITLTNDVGYDAVYVYHMAKADFFGKSLADEKKLIQYVKDYIDDPDGYDGLPMTRFYADCIGSGTPIMWEDLL